MAVHKVIYGSTVLMDITDSTVTASDMKDGVIAYDAKGDRIVGNLSADLHVDDFSGSVSLISGTEDQYMLTIGS